MKKPHFIVDGIEPVEVYGYLKNPEILLEKPDSALNAALEYACKNRKSIKMCMGNKNNPITYFEKNAEAIQMQRGFSKTIDHFAYVIVLELADYIHGV